MSTENDEYEWDSVNRKLNEVIIMVADVILVYWLPLHAYGCIGDCARRIARCASAMSLGMICKAVSI